MTDTFSTLIPMPAAATSRGGTFTLRESAAITADPGNPEVRATAEYLAAKLRPATGYALPVAASDGDIVLALSGDASLGEEGYTLTIDETRVTLRAFQPAGLFRGVQTLRQLFPPAIEHGTVQSAAWVLPVGMIHDTPRYPWRGAMLDVARHFFGVEDVKRYIDLAAYYKLNRFHLHLTDDQGWRIEIKSWPNLTAHGGSSDVSGGAGGYYTQEQYADLVAYAQARYVTLIPEIEMPGHTTAAMASYPELSCDDTPPALYTGYGLRYSSLCVRDERVYQFVEDVIREVASLTAGPYIHIGGDEAGKTPKEDYRDFIARVQEIVTAHGKTVIGWNEVAEANLLPTTIVQHWIPDYAKIRMEDAPRVIMSPGSNAYLDMKYDESCPMGLTWGGYVPVSRSYQWEPSEQLAGLPPDRILGVEAPLWTETVRSMADIEYMVFPRLLGIAEIGWSPRENRTWESYRARLAAHGPRLTAMGVNFFASPEVPWEGSSEIA